MGWPAAVCVVALVIGYCVCKYLDARFPTSVGVVDDDEEEDEAEEDAEDDDDETS